MEATLFVPSRIEWGEGPASLPKGAKLAVLEGDPLKEGPFVMRLKLPDGSAKEVDLKPGEIVPVSIPVCSSGPWSAVYEGPVSTNFGERLVTVRMTKPTFTPDPSACS